MNYNVFFRRKSSEVAIDLLGRTIVRNTNIGVTAARIIEVGAYEGGKLTDARQGMCYAPGRLFLMPFRGYYLFNISCDVEGFPSCVEIRKIAFHNKEISGSGRISRLLDLTPDLDRIVLGTELQIVGIPADQSKVQKSESQLKNCSGYYFI